MIKTFLKELLTVVLSLLLIFTAVPFETAGQTTPSIGTTNGYSGQGAPLSANELQQLVAPIALYPDALVAQILGATTFPDQIAYANGWLQQNKILSGTALMQAVDAQPWDPSVKALTQFPSVLNNLASNLNWTSALGEAYHTQTADVMSAVQVLRAKAYAAGNLKSGSQITVAQQSPEVIVIQPTNPQVVYVPTYNPTVVYGTPYVTPGYSAATVAATGLLAFGAGIAVGAAIAGGGGCCGWGYGHWNCNWHSGAVVYGNTAYYGNNAWHGGYYGSQYQTTSHGTVATYQSTTGAKGAVASGAYGKAAVGETASGTKYAAASGAYGNAAVAETANGNKYAESNGNVYKNTGSGWQQTQGTPKSGSSYSGAESNSAASRGWGGQGRSGGSSSSAFGGSGWQSRAESARGSYSRGGGGGWGGGRGRR